MYLNTSLLQTSVTKATHLLTTTASTAATPGQAPAETPWNWIPQRTAARRTEERSVTILNAQVT